MKKIIFTAFLFLLLAVAPVLAEGDQNQMRIQDPEVHMEDEDFEPGETGDQDRDRMMLQDGSGEGLEMFQNMENMMNRFEDPEVGEQVREMSQRQAEVQQQVQERLSLMSQKSGIAKFLFGPDYKNAVKLRENIQQLRDDAKSLSEISDDTVTSSTAEALNQEADTLEEELNNQLSGFSLFGWLFKLVNKY